MTVRHGLEVLRGEGVVVSTEKRGRFVARRPGPARAWGSLRSTRRSWSSSAPCGRIFASR